LENITEDSIKERLKKVISEELKIDSEEITSGSHIANDIGADSAEMINILFGVETEFDVEISNEEASNNLIIEDMAKMLKEKIDMKSAHKNT
jgi:acyl carrier protein